MEEIDVNALLADMQSDINDAGSSSILGAEDSAPVVYATVSGDTSDADVLSHFKSMMAADMSTVEITADESVVYSASSDHYPAADIAGSDPCIKGVGASVSIPAEMTTVADRNTDDASMETMSIADRCTALLSSVSLSIGISSSGRLAEQPAPVAVASSPAVGTGARALPDEVYAQDDSLVVAAADGQTAVDVDLPYADMSDRVAKFALEAMSEDEPKYTEKEMDVLHKKAKLEAAVAFEGQRVALLAQMEMMEATMRELAAEKEAMKAEMADVNELVKGFEAMADTVAKKKDDEIYQLFEAKKAIESERKELAAQCEALQLEVRTAGELKAMVALEHSEELNTLKDAHNVTLTEVRAQLATAERSGAQTSAQLVAVQAQLANAEKQRANFDAANRKLQASLEEANVNCEKYKQIGSKTRDQAQAQLDKAKELVIGALRAAS